MTFPKVFENRTSFTLPLAVAYISVPFDPKKIKESINLIINSLIDYEFRTTLVDGLHNEEDILKMAKKIKGAKLYVLQEFIPNNTLNPDFQKNKPISSRILKKLKPKIEKYVKKCVIYWSFLYIIKDYGIFLFQIEHLSWIQLKRQMKS